MKKNFQFSIFNFRGGFTFMEVVIATAVFLIIAIGAYRGYTAVYTAIAAARIKALAADLINTKFEIIKNLPYTDVGISGGDPSGVLSASETLVRDGITFDITTLILNVDDPFDGLAGSGDVFPNDYKLVEIEVVCNTCKNFDPIVITGRVAPKNLESA